MDSCVYDIAEQIRRRKGFGGARFSDIGETLNFEADNTPIPEK